MVKNEENNSIDAIYQKYYFRVLHYLSNLVGKQEAEDLTQETFLKIKHGLNSFKGKSKISTWIYRIASNTAIDSLRKKSKDCGSNKETDSKLIDEYEVENAFIKSMPKPPDEKIVFTEMTECIAGYMKKLPPDFQTVMVMKEYENLKSIEIAESLDITLETVKIRLHRGREKLRELFTCGCDFYRDKSYKLACVEL